MRDSRYKRRRRARRVNLAIILLLILAVVVMARTFAKDKEVVTEETIFRNMENLYATPEPTETPEIHILPTEDVRLLAKIMQAEDGIEWADALVMCIGEVVLNRVDSNLFPDTIRDVLYQSDPIQYAPVFTRGWEEEPPEERYIELAERLLDGERVLNNPDVVYQALFEQGDKTVLAYYDTALDTTTYFCTIDKFSEDE